MDNTTRFAAFAALFISLLAPSAPAQFPSSVTFSNDFNGDVPAGMTLTGSATVNGGYLKLTTHTPGGQLGTAFVDGLPSAQGVTAFRATFRAALFGGTIPPADGFSFNLAPAADASNGVTPGEEGLASGLTISFDTYDNGGEPPSISVRWNGILMGEQPVQVSTSPGGQSDPASRLRDFSIQLDSDGTVDVAHNGVFILNNLPTSYEPIYGGRWVLSARTGGFTDNHWFEDLNISATLTVPLSGNCLNLGGGFVEAAHHPSLNELPFAVGAWIRTTNQTQTGAGIVAKWAPNAQGNGFYMVMNAGRVVAFYGSATSALDNTLRSPLLADGQWHHVLFTVHFGAGTLWVDGQSADFLPSWEGQPAATTSTAPLLIGTWADGTNFIGEIDEVTLWSTADERFTVQRWNRRLSGFEPDLLAYYRFDEGSSNVAGDASGNGRTGQIRNNFAWVASAVPLLPGLDTLQIHGRVDSGDGTVTAAATAPVDIPDVATVESSMTVAAPGAIAGVKVNVNITHTFRGDLVITLIHPDGTAVILHNRDGGPDDDLVTTYPDLTAPAQSLAVLNGKPLNGTWVLRVQDAAGQDIGTLNTWSLELARPPQPPPPPMLMAALLDPATSASAAPVLDLRTNEYTLNVGAGDPVGFVQVDMDISHTFRGDLEISLIHPDGTAVRLKDADVNDDLADWVTSYADLTAPAQSL
ncbi:MAG TPA: proprotein convertase P-domain-containing protein, partial [Methylomirabilota bacterium]|nr:proprotein convertase P-domain-containing protein [Methylomirabilota bacterium]